MTTLDLAAGGRYRPDPTLPNPLTDREREVLALIAQGCTNHEIAAELYVSINSIKSYIRSAYRKIGISRRSQAVIWGMTRALHDLQQ
jgi:DNA-binding NarL/FixJ family response regulator